jgi:phosphoribosyl 1,2-cyclic phosphodiesterase
MAVSGDRYRRYGGNTTCYHAEVDDGHHLLVDCGSGLRSLDRDLTGRESQRFTVLFTHYHWDHMQGLPVFGPLFEKGSRVDFYGPPGAMPVRDAIDRVMRPPWWPVTLEDAASATSFHTLPDRLSVGPVTVSSVSGTHPEGVRCYRFDGLAGSAAIVTDHEAGVEETDAQIRSLVAGADTLIHDAQYSPEQLRTDRRGWGHSSYEGAVRAAAGAGAGRLVLTSHDPDRSDEEIDRLRGLARAAFPKTDAAYEGMTIPL